MLANISLEGLEGLPLLQLLRDAASLVVAVLLGKHRCDLQNIKHLSSGCLSDLENPHVANVSAKQRAFNRRCTSFSKLSINEFIASPFLL